MGLYIEINSGPLRKENGEEFYVRMRELLPLAYPLLKKFLESKFSFTEKKISLWKYSTLKALSGELIAENADPKSIKNESNGILQIEGEIKIYEEKIPIILEISADREYAKVYGDINIETSIESDYENLCDLLDEMPETEYKSFLDKLSNIFDEFNSDFSNIIYDEYKGKLHHPIRLAYISRFPVYNDITEFYYLYKDKEAKKTKVLLDIIYNTLTQNKEVELKNEPVIETRKKLTNKNSIVNFLSDIKEVDEAINTFTKGIVEVEAGHSIVLKLDRSKENREKLYKKIRDDILMKFFELLPETEKLKNDYIKKLKNQTSII